MSTGNERSTIPPELENMLLEFTVKVLVENPDDMVSYAADYFNELRDKRTSEQVSASGANSPEVDEDSAEYIALVLGNRQRRRPTIMGERYNPEEDTDDTKDEVYPKTDEQRRSIKERTGGVFLFRVLDDNDLDSVVDAMKPTPVNEGDVIIRQGDDGDFFYLIEEGDFDILIKDNDGEDKLVGAYKGEGFFGELALLYNQPRAATIVAATDGFLWGVGRQTFNRLVVKRAFEKRRLYMKLLDKVPELRPLTEYEKMQVSDALRGKSYSAGEVVFKEGDEGDGMYFIIEGKVGVKMRTSDDEEKEVSQLGRGQYFGELALVKHQPRAATIVAKEDTKAAFLDVKAFERLLGPCLDIMGRHAETYKQVDGSDMPDSDAPAT